jgi:hypothetical protein
VLVLSFNDERLGGGSPSAIVRDPCSLRGGLAKK